MKRIVLFVLASALLGVLSVPQSEGKSVRKADKPVIGIVGAYDDADGTVDCGKSYIEPVYRAGGVPVILPYCRSEADAQELISRIDGIVLIGGEDVQPEVYGEKVFNSTVNCAPGRDTSELYLVNAAVKASKAMLGICRGHQIINAALGGTLYQDIPSQMTTDLAHRQEEPSSVPTHTAHLENDSHIAALLGTDVIKCNSHHHQAVRVPGKGMRVVGRASDGVVEVCEGFPALNILTIQFHPEKLIAGGDDFYMPVFEDLVKRASKR